MTKVKIGKQIEDFSKMLAPEPRRALKRGIKGLERNEGDIKQLEGKLSGAIHVCGLVGCVLFMMKK